MAKMTPELKERFKALGISNGEWRGPDGKRYTVCRGGEFFMHSVKITQYPNRTTKQWVRQVTFEATRWHSSYGGGGYTNTVTYDTSLEKFNEIWEHFMLGYKEYEILKRKAALDADF